MREYLSRVKLDPSEQTLSIGAIAESVFERWFRNNFQTENIFKQSADRDYSGIDFVDEKGFKYQVKGSKGKTFTFNCTLEDLYDHLTCDYYVFIQIKDDVAFIEFARNKEQVLAGARESFNYPGSCFLWAEDFKQYKLEL